MFQMKKIFTYKIVLAEFTVLGIILITFGFKYIPEIAQFTLALFITLFLTYWVVIRKKEISIYLKILAIWMSIIFISSGFESRDNIIDFIGENSIIGYESYYQEETTVDNRTDQETTSNVHYYNCSHWSGKLILDITYWILTVILVSSLIISILIAFTTVKKKPNIEQLS